MTDLVAGLLVGFAGSAHCFAMCGPLSASLSLSLKRQSLLVYVAVGKIGLYAILGSLVAWLGSRLAPSMGNALFWLAGVLLIVMGLYGLGLRQPSESLTRLLRPLTHPIQRLAGFVWPIRNTAQALIWGGLWGLLPCGLVYAALGWALTAPSTVDGAMRMLGFGVGTLPAALGTGWLGHHFGLWSKSGRLGRLSGAILLTMGIWSIVIGVLQL